MKKWMFTCLLSQALAASVGIAAYGAQWQMDDNGWWYDNGDGTWPANQWQWLDGNGDGIAECYYFDHSGYCTADGVTPDGYQVNSDGAWVKDGVVQTRDMGGPGNTGMWKQDGGRWYFEDPSGSRKTNGWYWLDGNRDGISECYYFDVEGWLLTSTTTPDGYQVNADGAWTEGEIVKTKGAGGSGGTGTASGGRSSSGGGGSSGGSSSSGNSSGNTSSGKVPSRNHFWDDYEDYSVRHAANKFAEGNYEQMTESQIDAVERKIAEFKRGHIKSGMSDFEKEMEIVRWIIENCDYMTSRENEDDPYDWSKGTAHSCIVNGEACCAGYADAFLQMAKACGLSARYIHNTDHAWNLVKLDGEWYHVDVTWEDSGKTWKGQPLFVNLNDANIRQIAYHTSWSPNSIKANGIKYGLNAVERYLVTGSAESPERTDLQRLIAMGGKNVIYHTDLDDTISKIQEYLSDQIEKEQETYEYVVRCEFKDGDMFSTIDAHNLTLEIKEKAYGKLYDKYQTTLELITDEEVYKDVDETNQYYIYKKGKIEYRREIDYAIHFVENGKEVGKQTGSEYKHQKHRAVIYPDGYIYDYQEGDEYTINSGDGYFDGSRFEIYEGPLFDITVKVKKPAEKYTYQVIHMTTDGHVIFTDPIAIADKDSIIKLGLIELPDYVLEEGQELEKKLTTDGNVYYVYYEEVRKKREEEKLDRAENVEEKGTEEIVYDRIVLELEQEDKELQEEPWETEKQSEEDKDDWKNQDTIDESEDGIEEKKLEKETSSQKPKEEEESQEKENTDDKTKKKHEQDLNLNESAKNMNENTEEENNNTMEEDI